MNIVFPFSDELYFSAIEYIKRGAIGDIIFSRSNYQIKVQEETTKEWLWIFIHLNDIHQIEESLCPCEHFINKQTCVHIVAGYMFIFHSHPIPLHIRFEKSLWNSIFFYLFCLSEMENTSLSHNSGGYQLLNSKGDIVATLLTQNKKAKKEIKTLFFHRIAETEETSMKFSHLSQKELDLWRKKMPSKRFRYELSAWSDLAKRYMLHQEFGILPYITFNSLVNIPTTIFITLPTVTIKASLDKSIWSNLIPALSHYYLSSIIVYKFPNFLVKGMKYNRNTKKIIIEKEEIPTLESSQISITPEWNLIPNCGFIRVIGHSLFQKNELQGADIITLFEKYICEAATYLSDEILHIGIFPLQYDIYFDLKKYLHIETYLFSKGDLSKPDVGFFFPWIYKKGWYRVAGEIKKQKLVINSPDHIAQFIQEHAHWLTTFPGFVIHKMPMPFQPLLYTVEERGLRFYDQKKKYDPDKYIDLDKWIYLQHIGFYPKSNKSVSIYPGLFISNVDIPEFIHKYREELESIPKFFLEHNIFEEVGLEIYLNKQGNIEINSKYIFEKSYRNKNILQFFPYFYVVDEGFFQIPSGSIPEKYQKRQIIPKETESDFLQYELIKIRPYVLNLDTALQEPNKIVPQLIDITSPHTKEIHANIFYKTNLGRISLFKLWEAIQEKKKYILSEAGLIFLNQSRFSWLELLKKENFLSEEVVRLSPFLWIRLNSADPVMPPTNKDIGYKHWKTFTTNFFNISENKNLNTLGLQSTLRPYQKQGVEWLWFLYCHGLSGLLCDEMGLGKTHQVMGLLAAIQNHVIHEVRYLIVCPTSVIYHWEDLLEKFLPTFKILLFYGSKRSLNKIKHYNVVLTSYHLIRINREQLKKCFFEVVILDEIQIAKNYRAKIYKALEFVTHQSHMRVGLSGTPIENKLEELRALFDLVLPLYLPSESIFHKEFVIPIEREGNTEKQKQLQRMIQPFILRRSKKQVLKDLPEKVEEIIYCYLSEDQHQLYVQATNKYQSYIDEAFAKKQENYFHIFALFNVLKQICDHPKLVEKNQHGKGELTSGKWEFFIEIINEARLSKRKIVVFSQYVEMLHLMASYLKKQKIEYCLLTGSTRNRKAILEKFQSDPTVEVFLGSLKAAGLGITLTAASIVIHYDRWWNPAVENQATDRVYRYGQNRGVHVLKLVTKNTIEEHIHNLIEKKKNLFEGVLGFDNFDVGKKLNSEEILNLLRQVQRDLDYQ